MGLVAAAWMAASVPEAGVRPLSWLFLILLLFPIILQLAGGELRHPWRAFEMAVYVCVVWLIYRMAGTASKELLGSLGWCVMLGVLGNMAVLFAVLQQFHLPLFSGSAMFPVWQPFPAAFSGMLVQQNLQALFLVLVCMALWSRGTTEERAWPWWLASLLPCAGVLATSSRGGLLVLLVGSAMVLWMGKGRRTAVMTLTGIFLLAGVFSHYWHMFPDITGHAATLAERISEVGVEGRLFIWSMSWNLFLEHPWLGIGAGNLVSYGTDAIPPVLAVHPEYAGIASAMAGGHASAHNLLLQLLLEWGVIGALAMLAFLLLLGVRFGVMMWQRQSTLLDGRVQGGVGAVLMLLHGMFSVSLTQGYFLVLLALYSAALLAGTCGQLVASEGRSRLGLIVLLIPALFVIWSWQLFVTREWWTEEAANLSLDSPQFIHDVAGGINNPWSAHAALQWYLARIALEHEPAKIVASENFIYRYWMMHQGTVSLRYLILLAHLKDDTYAERRWTLLFLDAYPEHKASKGLREHAGQGHAKGEPLDLGI